MFELVLPFPGTETRTKDFFLFSLQKNLSIGENSLKEYLNEKREKSQGFSFSGDI